jgi:hypothetical protein
MATTSLQVPEPAGGANMFWKRSRPIVPGDAGNTIELIEILPGWLVLEVALVITTGFAGGTPSFTVGDADGAATWLASADITETTIGVYKGAIATPAVLNGKYYTTKQRLQAVISASLSSGSAFLLARIVELS